MKGIIKDMNFKNKKLWIGIVVVAFVVILSILVLIDLNQPACYGSSSHWVYYDARVFNITEELETVRARGLGNITEEEFENNDVVIRSGHPDLLLKMEPHWRKLPNGLKNATIARQEGGVGQALLGGCQGYSHYKISTENNFRGVSKKEFNKYIENYDSRCNGCIKKLVTYLVQ